MCRAHKYAAVRIPYLIYQAWQIGYVTCPLCTQRRGFGRFDQFDIVTGLPVRDVRMEPLAALASWQTRARNLFGSTDSEAQRGMHEDQAADDDAQSAAG